MSKIYDGTTEKRADRLVIGDMIVSALGSRAVHRTVVNVGPADKPGHVRVEAVQPATHWSLAPVAYVLFGSDKVAVL